MLDYLQPVRIDRARISRHSPTISEMIRYGIRCARLAHQRASSIRVCWHNDGEGGALTWWRMGRNGAAGRFNQAPANREAQARPLAALAGAIRRLRGLARGHEGLEQS